MCDRIRSNPTELSEEPAVTIAVAKRKNTNAVWIARDVLETMEDLKTQGVVPRDVDVVVTRNYGETADEKVNELAGHILVAVITVVVIIILGLGWRSALVVALAVPLTFSIA